MELLIGASTGITQLYKLVMARKWKSVFTIVLAVVSAMLGSMTMEEVQIYEGIYGGFTAVGGFSLVDRFRKPIGY